MSRSPDRTTLFDRLFIRLAWTAATIAAILAASIVGYLTQLSDVALDQKGFAPLDNIGFGDTATAVNEHANTFLYLGTNVQLSLDWILLMCLGLLVAVASRERSVSRLLGVAGATLLSCLMFAVFDDLVVLGAVITIGAALVAAAIVAYMNGSTRVTTIEKAPDGVPAELSPAEQAK